MSLLQEIEKHGLADCDFNRKLIDQDAIENLISDNHIFDMTDRVFWEVVNFLGIEDDCVELDPDTDGTRNTEHGALLYNVIEAALFNRE